jgi:type I restriction enzyme S subunit
VGYFTTTFAAAPFEIIDGDRGKAYPKQDDFRDAGHCLFLTAANVTKSGFDFGIGQFIDEQKDEQLRKGKLKRYDIVLTTRGTLGNVAYYDNRAPFEHVRINSGMVILRCERSKLLPQFLYGFLRSASFQGQVERMRSGVAQPQLPIRDMKRIEVPLPSSAQQERIAESISAYDDLIENNRRRITQLEEAVRMLYREWFVRFRFPGHEHVKIIDGIPEGWERCTVGDVLELCYGKALKEETRIGGPFPVYGSSGIVGTHQAALVSGPTIVVGRKGNVGSIYWAPIDFWPIDTVYFIPKEQADFWLYLALPSVGFQNTDGGVPGLNRDFAHSRTIIRPSGRMRRFFNEFVDPMFAQRATLTSYNQKLAQARDLLLPRLMNGEIAV